MAAVTTFKQQCPSCEAMVSIKDNMIGKKIECHKCKDTFIAKRPVEEDDDDVVDLDLEVEEETNGKKNGKPARKPAKDDDDDIVDLDIEEEDAPKPKNGKVARKPAKDDDIDELEDVDDLVDVEEEEPSSKNGKKNGTAAKNGKPAKKPARDEDDDVVDVDVEDEDDKPNGKKDTKVAKSKTTAVKAGAAPAAKRPKLEVDEDDDEEDERPLKKGKARSNGKPSKAAADDDEDADDEDDEDEGKKKSNKLVIGLGLAAVGVVILIIAAIFVMPGRNRNPVVVNNPGNKGVNPDDKKGGDNVLPPPPKIDEPPPAAVALTDAELAKLSNLLPNDTEHVFRVAFRDIFAANSPLRNAVFETKGALDDADLRKQLGFSVLAIDDLIVAGKYTAPGWRYSIIHFSEVVNEKELKSALKLDSGGTAIDGQSYYRMSKPNAAFDQLARFSFGIPNYFRYFDERVSTTSYLRLHNPQTLIVGDMIPVLAFLKAKGQFPLQSGRAPTPVPDPKGGVPDPKGGMVGGNPMPPAGGLMGGDPMPPGKDTIKPPPGPGRGKGGAMRPAADKGEFVAFSDQGAQPPADDKAALQGEWVANSVQDNGKVLPPEIVNGWHVSVKQDKMFVTVMLPTGKKVIETTFTVDPAKSPKQITITEPGKKPGLGIYELTGNQLRICLRDEESTKGVPAAFTSDAGSDLMLMVLTRRDPNSKDPTDPGPAGGNGDMYLTIKPSLKTMLDKMEVRNNEKDKILFSSATDMDANCIDPAKKNLPEGLVVRQPRQFWDVSLMLYESKPRIRFLGTALVQRDTLKYQLRNELNCAQEIDAQEFEKELMERTSVQIAKFIKQMVKHEVKLPRPGMKPPPPKVDDKTPPPPPGKDPPPKEDNKKPEALVSQITVSQQLSSVEFHLDLVLDGLTAERARDLGALTASILRVEIDAAGARSLRHELARAGHQLGDKGLSNRQVAPGNYPPGAFPRPTAPTYVDKEPRNRISWMAGLLPYLGHDTLYRKIDFNQSWRDPKNWMAGHTPVPQFLDPMYPDFTRQAAVGDLPLDFAATHYVGIAGVGENAASYRRGDAATVNKRGVFSYDGAASMQEIQDGRGSSNTILMIQIPHEREKSAGVGPWIAGGGATLRGVPETKSIQPFILGKDRDGKQIMHGKKKGTFALMTDGSVRFIEESISDDVFKALATVQGQAPPEFDPKTDPKTPLVPGPAEPKKTPDKKGTEKKEPKTEPEKAVKMPARHQGAGRIYEKANKFSILLPSGWEQVEKKSANTPILAVGPSTKGFTANMNVRLVKDDGSSLPEMIQEVKVTLTQGIKGWKLLSESPATIDNKKAHAMFAQFPADATQVKTVVYLVKANNGSVYLLSFGAEASAFDALRPVFEQCALGTQID